MDSLPPEGCEVISTDFRQVQYNVTPRLLCSDFSDSGGLQEPDSDLRVKTCSGGCQISQIVQGIPDNVVRGLELSPSKFVLSTFSLAVLLHMRPLFPTLQKQTLASIGGILPRPM